MSGANVAFNVFLNKTYVFIFHVITVHSIMLNYPIMINV